MKRPLIWTIGVVAIILVLGIGMFIGKQQASTPTPHHKTTHKSAPKTEETTTAPVTTEKTMVEKVSDFSAQIMPIIDKINKDEAQIGNYAREGTNDPSIVNDITYRDNVRLTCMDLATNVANLRAVPEPTDPKLATVWMTMQTAINDLDYIATNYVQDVENQNTQDLGVVADKTGEVGQVFLLMKQQITNLLTE